MTKEVKKEKKNNKKALIIILVLLLVCVGGYFGYKYYQQKQIEKRDAEYQALKDEVRELIDASEKIKEIKESEAINFTLESLLPLDEKRFNVVWDKDFDMIRGDTYTATVTAFTSDGNEVSRKGQYVVIINDDVKPKINISTNEFAYQVKEDETFELEMLNTIVGDVKDTKDGDIPYKKNEPSGKGYYFTLEDETVDLKKLADGQRFTVIMTAKDNAGNKAEELITVRCSKNEVENPEPVVHEHKLVWTTTREPNCTSNGLRTGTCSECGEKVNESIPALGHSFSWKTTKEPTCTSAGTRTGTCSRCNKTQTESIKALGHDFKVSSEKSPTCTEDGERTQKCSRCGETKSEKLNALGHSYKVVSENPATCEHGGSKTLKCSRCGDTKTETLAQLEHEYVEVWVVDVPAWTEIVHHDAEIYKKPVYKEVRYYHFVRRADNSELVLTHEQIVERGYRNADDMLAKNAEEFHRYYTKTVDELIGYEDIIVKPAWDEEIKHPEQGHKEYKCKYCGRHR